MHAGGDHPLASVIRIGFWVGIGGHRMGSWTYMQVFTCIRLYALMGVQASDYLHMNLMTFGIFGYVWHNIGERSPRMS
jgi:hypothetical protein